MRFAKAQIKVQSGFTSGVNKNEIGPASAIQPVLEIRHPPIDFRVVQAQGGNHSLAKPAHGRRTEGILLCGHFQRRSGGKLAGHEEDGGFSKQFRERNGLLRIKLFNRPRQQSP